MNYGFVIDNRKCIGCHACTVACKTENHVPVGVNRTWVKYVDKGVFPSTRRVFQVTRCNHCAKPPCVAICPVTAMYQRKDGIVDFNPERCIGCKACMQACPYDSIYMDPDDGTAAKCHFCAHRTEVGLEPACVIVCPEHAIIAGDLNDPASEAAQLVAREPVRVRKPEQGTQPKLYYIEADESAIVPMAARHESIYMWAQRNAAVMGGGAVYPADSPLLQENAVAAYDVAHARPWGWQVPAYCWTKSIGSGALAVPAIAMLLGRLSGDRVRDIALATIALLFTALTTVLLVWDLDHKERFLRVVLTPQSKSWLARGAFILIAYSGLCGVFWLASVAGLSWGASVLLWPTILVGFCAAVYTAFLFGQCEGRDLWQTPLLPAHLIVQALLCGSAVLALLPAAIGGSARTVAVAVPALVFSVSVHLLMLLGEVVLPHKTDNASYGARLMTRGPFAGAFWGGGLVVGGVIPLLLLVAGPLIFRTSNHLVVGLAGLLVLAGLLIFEWCFVMAGQSVPNS
ncbi:MAG: 4Fe-4S dicluster domain-containing protein [Terriglobales bacterium]|jgi:Fe-S-cluster-containing dehydrogenase component/formate-dependent nitrite reductase membrane component NrfD